MGIMTDADATELVGLCPPHKVVIDGAQLQGTIAALCTLAYQPQVFKLATTDPEVKAALTDMAMAMHEVDKALSAKLAAFALKVAAYK